MNTCVILIGYRDTAVGTGAHCYAVTIRLLTVGFDVEGRRQEKCGCTRRIARLHFGCCHRHQQM